MRIHLTKVKSDYPDVRRYVIDVSSRKVGFHTLPDLMRVRTYYPNTITSRNNKVLPMDGDIIEYDTSHNEWFIVEEYIGDE